MLSRVQCALLALFFCASLVSCAGDYLWWPGFNPITTAYTNQVPVHDVALEVQCEIYSFLEKEENEHIPQDSRLLDPTKGAGVVLILQTDFSGSVQYVGIDLSKLGFPSLASLVATTGKAPSLQAKGTGKTTISAEVDFSVLQTDASPAMKPKKPPDTVLKQSDIINKVPYENATFKLSTQVPGAWEPKRAPDPSTYFPNVNDIKNDCIYKIPLERKYLYLWLDEWLYRYRTYINTSVVDEPFICNTKVTLKSAWQDQLVIYSILSPLLPMLGQPSSRLVIPGAIQQRRMGG
jgi:hypothetical protein